MDSHSFRLLIILSLLCLQSRADGTGSIFFLDSATHKYFRTPSSDAALEADSMLLPEVGAAVSVLLGFAPPATLSAASSLKLNEVLMPNPFDRPHTVFMLEVKGAFKDSEMMADSNNAWFGRALKSKVIFGPNNADIQLPDENEVSMVSLNEPSSFDSDAEFTDQELNDLASWLGGSYITIALEPLNGELTIPLTSGAHMNLHMSKKADREFTENLVSLIWNIQRAMKMHQDLSGSLCKSAELMMGIFRGIEALQEEYVNEGVAQQGVELFLALISKIFDSLQAVYKGQIVGVILFNGTPPPESETMLNVKFISRPSPRWLEETEVSSNSTIYQEVVLVRWTLAWITGIILLIATLLGVMESTAESCDHAIVVSLVSFCFYAGSFSSEHATHKGHTSVF
ncbi:hypothetical protein F0562_035192 [Nyssa sinensis]|uniref:DUF7794 domain-containing protein n=1 Tax=Nyssa sinensis TaxID=561372 RepID=A0A5J5ACH7_9ASTE|nr:hypothetical protein F0562_035192 [Nyssa sinensis]